MDFKYIRKGKCSVLVDGQFGSTGKGLLAAYLASQPQNKVDFATTNAAANAGHWTKFKNPNKTNFCCFHLPTFGVIQKDTKIYLNAGSIINPELLFDEMYHCGVLEERVTIHPNASIIYQEDIDAEMEDQSQATKISSTRKGVGQALSNKVRRTAKLAKDNGDVGHMVEDLNLNMMMSEMDARVSMEVPQGYSLSINGPFYPYCTSRNCTVASGLNDANVHPAFLGQVAMANRTFPIRVGSIPKLGYSGDVYPDQHEIDFKTLGVEEELTTVTQRVRRIFTWSNYQMADAILDNRPSIYFLNFCNYTDAETVIKLTESIQEMSYSILSVHQQMLHGWGPNIEDVKQVPWEGVEYDA